MFSSRNHFHFTRITEGKPKGNRRKTEGAMITEISRKFHGLFTECSRKCSRKCLWNGHTFVERLVCLARSYVTLKNIWPSKPRDNRSGTEGKLHGIFESGIQAVWLGSRGSAGLLFGRPELGGKARQAKGSGNNGFLKTLA